MKNVCRWAQDICARIEGLIHIVICVFSMVIAVLFLIVVPFAGKVSAVWLRLAKDGCKNGARKVILGNEIFEPRVKHVPPSDADREMYEKYQRYYDAGLITNTELAAKRAEILRNNAGGRSE